MTGLFENPAIIRGIYKEQIPSLNNIDIHEIKIINGEDLICDFRFDLNEYPTAPPPKWKQAGYNTSQMSLKLVSSQIITFNIKNQINKGDLVLEEKDDLKVFKFIQDSVPDIIIKCKWIYINDITGYLKQEQISLLH